MDGAEYGRASWPAPSKNGTLYFHFAPSSERDLVRGAMQIRELDLETGKVFDVTEGQSQQQYQGSSGGAIAPEPSPDGRWLAFARRIPGGTISFKGHRFGPRTALFLRDLHTGAERLLADPIETDLAEGMKTERVLPGYSWSPDSSAIYVLRGGRIVRVDAASGATEEVPFVAEVRRRVSEQARAEFDISGDTFRARMIRWPAVSPDGSVAVFHAAGRLYRMTLPDGAPERLIQGDDPAYELSPAFSAGRLHRRLHLLGRHERVPLDGAGGRRGAHPAHGDLLRVPPPGMDAGRERHRGGQRHRRPRARPVLVPEPPLRPGERSRRRRRGDRHHEDAPPVQRRPAPHAAPADRGALLRSRGPPLLPRAGQLGTRQPAPGRDPAGFGEGGRLGPGAST